MHENSSHSVLPLQKNIVDESYEHMISNLSSQNDRIYVTGGALILALAENYGFASSSFDDDQNINVAGKSLSLRGVWLMWKFYSVLNFYGYKFACVDERLLPGTSASGIHEHCGACAACAPLFKLNSGSEVEDQALKLLKKETKQGILTELENEHSSVGLLISCGDIAYSLSDNAKLERFHKVGSIPFHVSFPIEKIRLFGQNLAESDKILFYKTLVDWNCGIVLRIIAGNHNLRAGELKTIGLHAVLMDTVENDELLDLLKNGIQENISEIFGDSKPEIIFVKESRDFVRSQTFINSSTVSQS